MKKRGKGNEDCILKKSEYYWGDLEKGAELRVYRVRELMESEWSNVENGIV